MILESVINLSTKVSIVCLSSFIVFHSFSFLLVTIMRLLDDLRYISPLYKTNTSSFSIGRFIDEIKNADTINLEFNDRLFNLTVLNIKVHKKNHLEFNFKDGSVVNIEL